MIFKHSVQPNPEEESIGSLLRFTIIIVCICLLFRVVLLNVSISSGSMEPTLMTGELAIYNRLSYDFQPVQRGDIIAFWSNDILCLLGQTKPKVLLSKRVIAIEGDTIEFHNQQVYINGVLLDESSYLPEDVYTEPNPYTGCCSYVVPKDCVFVMGDNRSESYDSRYFDNPFIPMDDIVGEYFWTIPFINFSQIKNFFAK